MNSTFLRFTLSNPDLGDLKIDDPISADTAPLSLVRDRDFSEVHEMFDSPLTFTGRAIGYLKDAERIGLDVAVLVIIEITEDSGATWEDFYRGLIDIETKNDLQYPTEYKLQYNLKKTDLWSAFYNRKSSVVDVVSPLDMDGNAVAPQPVQTISLPDQQLPQQYSGYNSQVNIYEDDILTGEYLQLDFDQEPISEIKTKFHIPLEKNHDLPAWNFSMDFAGTYRFQFQIRMTMKDVPHIPDLFISPGAKIACFMQVKDNLSNITSYPMARVDFTTGGVGYSDYTLDQTVTIPFGSQIFFFGQATVNIFAGNNLIYLVDGALVTFLKVTAQTKYPATTCKAILLKDIMQGIVKRTCGGDLYSPLFQDGCGKPYVLFQGLQARGESFTTKSMGLSMDDVWAIANPIFKLGMGTEIVGDVEQIYIDDKEKFYDKSDFSLEIPFVNNITTTIRTDGLVKSAHVGYGKWQLTSGGSLIDDISTNHDYTGPSRYNGKALSMESKAIAAGLLIELARRATITPNQTYDLDNDVFILKLEAGLVNPDLSGATTNLFNGPNRYNKTLTPARMFLKWLDVMIVGLQPQYTNKLFRFIKGVGNYIAGVTVANACEVSGAIVENRNMVIQGNPITGTDVIDFEWPLSWAAYKVIRAKKRMLIGVSSTAGDFIYYFIEKIDFYLFQGKAKFTLLEAAVVTNDTCEGIGQLITNVGAEYHVDFGHGVIDLTITEVIDGVAQIIIGKVTANVTKIDNGGVAIAPVNIDYIKNGIVVANDSFNIGDTVVSSKIFTFVATSDILKVTITEFAA